MPTRQWNSDTGGLFYEGLFELTSLRTFDEVTTFINQLICPNPVCVETGTAYGFPEGEPYWNTTSSIVKRICEPKDEYLISVDLLDRTEVIDKLFLAGNTDRNKCILKVGDSVQVLSQLDIPYIDFLCLDSGEDEELLLHEYLTIQHLLSEKHYVLVDDIHNTHSVKYKKIVPHLKNLGYTWMQVPTETGLFVSAKGYPIP